MKQVQVAVGVIINDHNEVLIALRANHQHQGGKWEFPGGKIEAGEPVEQALARELLEELGIEVHACNALMRIDHDYGDKQVSLLIRTVTDFSGQPHGREGQPLRWVPIDQLHHYPFPEANKPIVARIQTGK